MKTLVLYESQFGNTRHIAELIGQELGLHGPVRVTSIGDYTPAFLDGVDLVAVGGPTQVHGMTAAMRKFLGDFESMPKGVPAVAFDTRVSGPVIFTGSAARGIQRELKAGGFKLVAEPESFLIAVDKRNLLMPAEEEHAVAWAKKVVLGLPVPV